ncbi:hypothetical protein [Reichenbachiella sp.]|uniref:hypothetical protein n=1 Tax=Reichenbachiella sp. TaxID=2184521 RepID=UPI00329A4B84
MKDNMIKKILKDQVVSLFTLILISVILFAVDWSLSTPLYTLVLDMPGLGNGLAFGMAVLMGTLPKITAKLLASENKKRQPLALIAIALSIGLICFIFFGQKEVTIQGPQNPLTSFLAGEQELSDAPESNRHIIATALVTLLYSIATFIGYLYYSDETRFKPTGYRLSMSKLSRSFRYQLTIAKGRFDRALSKLTTMAEAPVNKRIYRLETNLKKYKRELDKYEQQQNYELQGIENAKARVKAAIKTIYRSNNVQS